MDNTKITPADIAIDLFGGVRKLARAVNRDPAAVSRWKKSGNIPSSIQRKLLMAAVDRGIAITANDIVFGRQSNE